MALTVGHDATSIRAAVAAARTNMVDPLIPSGIDVDVAGGDDKSTALHVAAWHDSLQLAKQLVAAGADINQGSGRIHHHAPAGWAIVAGSAEVFTYLMDLGVTRRDHFLAEAQASVRGEFRQYKCVPMKNDPRILARLSAAP